MKQNMYIMAGGKSSRFGGTPKILETFDSNKELLNEYFNVFIVCSKEIHKKINHLDSNFIIQQMGNGSGTDVFNLFNKFKQPAFVCWSDAFFNEQVILDIIELSKENKNSMTITKKSNPYVSIKHENNIFEGYEYNKKTGYQDNSVFYIQKLEKAETEFMDMALLNNFRTKVTSAETKYFNTKEELDKLLVKLSLF